MVDIPFHPDSLRLFPQRNHRIPSAGFPDTRRLTAVKGFIPVVSPILRYYESVERRLRLSGPLFTTKEGAKGTGLGLAVVMGVIEGHGGFVEAESAVGVGSKVRIFLPVLEQGVGAAVKAGGQVAPAPGGTETILFVEDEVRLRNTLCECLEEKWYIVLAVGDGQEALNVFESRAKEISLVLSDLDMPNLDGEALSRRVKALRKETPVLVLAGFMELERKSQPLEIGVDDVILKPARLGELLVKIREMIDHDRHP